MNYDVIREYFDNIEIKDEAIKLDQGTTITNPKKFYQSHCAFLDGNRGNKRYKPYYDQLVKFYNYYESKK